MTTTNPGVTPGMFLSMLGDQRERENVSDGLKAAVHQFYGDYTDADDVRECDPAFYAALEKIAVYADGDLDEIIQAAQDEITDLSGRKFKRAVEDEA